MGVEQVLARRRAERTALVNRAAEFAQGLPAALDVRAVIVFGSVARGDFNLWSDIDVLVVAATLPARALDRLDALGARPAKVQPVAWTPGEWAARSRAGDPISSEARGDGVWLLGSSEDLDALQAG